MAGMRCYICGKKRIFGKSISHSGVRTNRVFAPNLQWRRVNLSGQGGQGQVVRIRICTKCLKRLKKDGRVAQAKEETKKEVKQETPTPTS